MRQAHVDAMLESAIVELLSKRDAHASICPSEAARAVAAGLGRPGSWRDLMASARDAAIRLVERGEVTVTQGGRPVDPSTARGPVRIRRVPS